MKKHMAKANLKKKFSTVITKSIESRIVELSLQNPEFGARRLLPLLNSVDINVSASTVYNILKRHSLQTRAKRLANLKKKNPKAVPVPTKKAKRSRKQAATARLKRPARVTGEVAERIVQVSLNNPDYGARRLVSLLEKDGIRTNASTVYRILKRNDLQNREKRFARIRAQEAEEISSPEAVEISAPQSVAVPAPLAQPEPAAGITLEKVTAPRFQPIKKAPEKTKFQRSLILTLSNVLLLVLLAYLGVYAAQSFRHAGLESAALAAPAPAPAGIDARPETAAPPLTDYRIIWERNLFNVSKKVASVPEKQIAIENIAPAKKDLGIKLVGTAVADDPRLSRAFIDNRSTGEQEAYREGDRAGEVRIKKIQRNNVIIATREGDRLLTVEIGTAAIGQTTSKPAPQTPATSTLKQSTGSISSSARTRSVSLDRQEVEASLANIDRLIADLDIAPYTRFEQPAGFKISNISNESIFKKIGLSSRDVIVGINNQKITGPDQAAEFINTIAKGGQVTIRARRRLRTRRINLNIE
jgi:general secretion pathway protein C